MPHAELELREWNTGLGLKLLLKEQFNAKPGLRRALAGCCATSCGDIRIQGQHCLVSTLEIFLGIS